MIRPSHLSKERLLSSRSSSGSRGFTLVEALIAIVLIVIGIGGAMGAISAGLRAQTAGRFYSTAARLAQGKIAEIESSSDLSPGVTEGDFLPEAPGFFWTCEIVEQPELTGLWQVHLEVAHRAASDTRSVSIDTYLLKREP